MRCPFATWTPVGSLRGGENRGGPGKGVAHKTQGRTLAAALAAYRAKGCPPHFTIAEDGRLHQHVDTDRSSYALRNPAGGVETNRDGAVQVEIVGFSGKSMTAAQAATMRRLMAWLRDAEGIPWRWPGGRPPVDDRTGYGEKNGHRSARLWDSTGGWYGHSQVPENAHWDPAWTDDEWAAVESAGAAPPPAATPSEDDMPTPRDLLAAPLTRLGPGGQRVWDRVVGKRGATPTAEQAIATAAIQAAEASRLSAAVLGQLAALRAEVAAVARAAAGDGVDLAAVQEAARKGVADAFDGASATLTLDTDG